MDSVVVAEEREVGARPEVAGEVLIAEVDGAAFQEAEEIHEVVDGVGFREEEEIREVVVVDLEEGSAVDGVRSPNDLPAGEREFGAGNAGIILGHCIPGLWCFRPGIVMRILS